MWGVPSVGAPEAVGDETRSGAVSPVITGVGLGDPVVTGDLSRERSLPPSGR